MNESNVCFVCRGKIKKRRYSHEEYSYCSKKCAELHRLSDFADSPEGVEQYEDGHTNFKVRNHAQAHKLINYAAWGAIFFALIGFAAHFLVLHTGEDYLLDFLILATSGAAVGYWRKSLAPSIILMIYALILTVFTFLGRAGFEIASGAGGSWWVSLFLLFAAIRAFNAVRFLRRHQNEEVSKNQQELIESYMRAKKWFKFALIGVPLFVVAVFAGLVFSELQSLPALEGEPIDSLGVVPNV